MDKAETSFVSSLSSSESNSVSSSELFSESSLLSSSKMASLSIPIDSNIHNKFYLKTKRDKMGHTLSNLDE